MATLEDATQLMSLFADPTRVRLLSLLAREELTVAELTNITQLAQSRVSTHLGKLKDADVLRDRRVGASTFYAVNDGAMPDEARKIWQVLEQGISDATIGSDRQRCEVVLKARARAAAWPDAVAGEMDRHYSPGRTWESLARGLVGLVQLGDVLDCGCGDGAIAQLLASRAKRIVGVDRSERLIAAARGRLTEVPNVRFEVADLHALPYEDATYDHVLLFNVLTYAEQPARVLSEARRVLRTEGSLVITTLDAHDHLNLTASYHHVNAGFRPATLKKMLQKAGFHVVQCEVTSRERRAPHLCTITAFAHTAKPSLANGE